MVQYGTGLFSKPIGGRDEKFLPATAEGDMIRRRSGRGHPWEYELATGFCCVSLCRLLAGLSKSKQRGRVPLGILLVLFVLLLNGLAASPSLHEYFHADANHADHQCAVTLFAHGQVDSAAAEVSAVAPVVAVETTPQVSFSLFAPAIENLPAGRAPPVSVSSPV